MRGNPLREWLRSSESRDPHVKDRPNALGFSGQGPDLQTFYVISSFFACSESKYEPLCTYWYMRPHMVYGTQLYTQNKNTNGIKEN
ncbi:hypothetical protein AFLA_006863 [Aspergillus flavus NRRL3357]|nr:hypothetical protein AFLA_006863 [Aspergillus flavus NRRL3357]